MATTDPLVLSDTTRFAPAKPRGHSRSPSRSPIRKSQFLARELDPLLSNLSPDSTLKALQATSTIAQDGSGRDALAKSIADVSPSEREIGIRAALAAQKLRQWRHEVEQWTWPVRRERARGAGFLMPKRSSLNAVSPASGSHLGFLPTRLAYEYEDRLEDIRDGIEALELEDIKDHVFSAHVPNRTVTTPERSGPGQQPNYGRMRDFTALVTATVIQALPDMANLNLLLDTWEIRLSILRQIPGIEGAFKTTKAGVETASSVIRDAETGPLVTLAEFETAKTILGDKVSALGAKIDRLLDTLEGQEDTLPQEWLDSLESIENEYAAWVVEAERVAIRNDITTPTARPEKGKAIKKPTSGHSVHFAATPDRDMTEFISNGSPALKGATIPSVVTSVAALPTSDLKNTFPFLSTDPEENKSHRKPSLQVGTGHRRGVSDVSMAGSAYSGISDLSEAEIVDARSTQVLTSPKVNLVDNPFRASREELSGYPPRRASNMETSMRPPLLQRASTASIEVISKEQVRQLVLNRSQSHEILGTISQSPPSTPSKALRQLTGDDGSPTKPQKNGLDSLTVASPGGTTSRPALSQHPSAMVDPLNIKTKEPVINDNLLPDVPRRSSKRLSVNRSVGSITPPSPPSNEKVPETPVIKQGEVPTSTPASNRTVSTRPTTRGQNESLEDKIKDILTTMPTKIRLANESEIGEDNIASLPLSRSSTPAPTLTISPVKADRTGRKAAPGDVRLFHLTRAGQSRDTPPVKLFVRAVGENGERVMVRVGGGWADLGEYLREYSAHHGHRNLNDGELEVASYPNQNVVRESSPAINSTTISSDTTPSPSTNNDSTIRRRSFGFGSLSNLTIGKSRKNSQTQPVEAIKSETTAWTPPPVPNIPQSYIANNSPRTTANGISATDATRSISPSMNMRHSMGRPLSGTTSIVTPTNSSNRYTPLGAAGPINQGRRVMSYNSAQNNGNEAWVEGMVGKARAVSNNNTTTVFHSPTVTTTTTVHSRSTPGGNRRVSTLTSVSPPSNSNNNSGTASPIPPSTPSSPLSTNQNSPSGRPTLSTNSSNNTQKSKNRMSFSDVSGIKRVFLRRKSSNNSNLNRTRT